MHSQQNTEQYRAREQESPFMYNQSREENHDYEWNPLPALKSLAILTLILGSLIYVLYWLFS